MCVHRPGGCWIAGHLAPRSQKLLEYLLIQVALVRHKDVQGSIPLVKQVEVVVAEEDCQLVVVEALLACTQSAADGMQQQQGTL